MIETIASMPLCKKEKGKKKKKKEKEKKMHNTVKSVRNGGDVRI